MATEGTTPARKGPTDIFIARDFLPPQPTYTKWTSEFYELRDEVNSINSVIQTAREYGNVERAKRIAQDNKRLLRFRGRLNRMSRGLSDLRQKEVRVRSSERMSAEEKREALDALQRRRNDVVKNVQKMQDAMAK
jgi:tRNA uridine 5-carbamoylmethylation protein Kti12